MHFIGIQGCPRKYKALAEKFACLTSVSSFGATISTVRIWWFISIFVETFSSYRLVLCYNTMTGSIEWCVEHTAHTYVLGVTLRTSRLLLFGRAPHLVVLVRGKSTAISTPLKDIPYRRDWAVETNRIRKMIGIGVIPMGP